MMLHPSFSQLVRFISTLAGRDKLLYFIQYSGRLSIWLLSRTNGSGAPIEAMRSLIGHIIVTRKFLRVGNNIEFCLAAVTRLNNKSQDAFLNCANLARQPLLAGYLTCDSITLIQTLKLYVVVGVW
ncbi:peroxisomal biogenesis factor 11 [Mariannaea sp. PMI_226]|nr:peroxisomal biogenesis factor 11 [Mariannaea sp. PMI_226]